ncbi:MAG: RNA methyltransferase [Bacteroidales bacterium]|nr:RNA methyltransferase [Bacteroidales bacterium]
MQKLSMEQLGRLSVEEYKKTSKTPVVVVLDNVRSALNVGSVFRTSDAFKLEKIMLCGITATPPNPEIRKTAIGAEQSVDFEYFKTTVEAVEKLKNEGYKIFAVEQAKESIPLNALDLSGVEKLALVFGNEVKGVDDAVMELCEKCIEIPQFGTKHSLNVSVSAGIVIWEVFNRLKKS